jgi:hypothetical protein
VEFARGVHLERKGPVIVKAPRRALKRLAGRKVDDEHEADHEQEAESNLLSQR